MQPGSKWIFRIYDIKQFVNLFNGVFCSCRVNWSCSTCDCCLTCVFMQSVHPCIRVSSVWSTAWFAGFSQNACHQCCWRQRRADRFWGQKVKGQQTEANWVLTMKLCLSLHLACFNFTKVSFFLGGGLGSGIACINYGNISELCTVTVLVYCSAVVIVVVVERQ